MVERRAVPYVWVTWLARVLTGEQSCAWASWFKAKHQGYARTPSDFNQARWQMEHTRLLTDFSLELRRRGDQVFVEAQNSFKYKRQSGLIVAGVPDVVGVAGNATTVYDVKTGRPRVSDQAQVMIYMYCIPRCSPQYESAKPAGCVVYNDHRLEIPADTIDGRFSDNLHHFLDILEADHPAPKVPSASGCRFCDITRADCPERIDAPAEEEEGEISTQSEGPP